VVKLYVSSSSPGSVPTPFASPASLAGYLPWRIVRDGGAPQVEWIFGGGARFTEPFLEDTLARLRHAHPSANARAARLRTPLEALRDLPSGVPLAGLIFHVSRCGSTLVAQMLAALPQNIVAAEPPIFDDLLRTAAHDPRVTDDDRIAWLRGAVRSLGQPNAHGGARLFVKLDCWQIFSLPLLRRAFPGVPLAFVYREPLEVLASLVKRASVTLIRGTVSPAQLGLAAAERDALSPAEHAAAILGSFFREALRHRAHLTPLAYEDLPHRALDAWPALTWSEADRAAMLAAAALDTKNPGQAFTPDAAAKRAAAPPALAAACARWASPPYRAWLRALAADYGRSAATDRA